MGWQVPVLFALVALLAMRVWEEHKENRGAGSILGGQRVRHDLKERARHIESRG